MVIYEGKAVFEGIAIGKISVYKKQEQLVKSHKYLISSVAAALAADHQLI